MSYQITIKPSDHTFAVEDGETVLSAALRENFGLPYGCRNGACGTCKGKILQGQLDYGVYQGATLTEAEKVAGYALFCVAKPKCDLVIECKEIGAIRDIVVKTLPCRVQKLERVAADVIVMSLKLPANERLQFLAGQYIDLIHKDGTKRSFSLANAPHDDEYLQLHIRNVAGGKFTEYVFDQMKERDILRFTGPLGSFFLHEDSDRPIVLLASGTGFAPIKAIVEHAIHRKIQRPMVLYWGARTLADLYLHDLPKQWANDLPNFRYVPVLSEPQPADQWQGRTGLVHAAVLDDLADLSEYEVYACGAPIMVEAAHTSFTTQRGLSESRFFSDAFTFVNPAAGGHTV